MRKRIIIFAGGILCLTLMAIGYHLYNMPRKTAADIQTDKQVSAKELFEAFVKDEQAANIQYGNKILEVTGTVTDVQQSGADLSILLSGENSQGGINCTLVSGVNTPAPNVGELVHIKGRCTGFIMDVSLIDATIVNHKK
ncbi:tRNA_anti-like [Chitinophaga sp. CF118]|nr:tRNA_anti-like [Chitinophaga sp. CF118]